MFNRKYVPVFSLFVFLLRWPLQLLKQHLEKQNIDVITTNSNKDAINIVLKDASVHSVLFDWTMEHPDYEREKFMRQVRKVKQPNPTHKEKSCALFET